MRFIFKWNANYTILRNNLEVKYYAKKCDLNKYFPSSNTNIFPSGKKINLTIQRTYLSRI